MSATLEQTQEMNRLIRKLIQATITYDEGCPIISDKEWDDMYFRLVELEKETGEIFPNSPTQKIHFQTVSELKKVEHNHLMLSLDKTKDIEEIKKFINNHDWIAMAKMDGLTCSLCYKEGKLISAETRGNGTTGEDITHNAMVIPSIPKNIPYKEEVIIDGEIICTYKNFKKFEDTYRNPRNFAAGSIRLLDSKECASRNLTFVAWDVIKGGHYDYLSNNLSVIATWGFEVVPRYINNKADQSSIEEDIEAIKKWCKGESYPIDGIVFKYDTIKEYELAGRTDHHFKGGLAYKFYDEIYETEVKDIEWTMGRTGQLTPVLVYNDIEINGTVCNRASLHNISIMTELMGGAYPGQKVFIYKANEIIPQVESAQNNNPNHIPMIEIPKICPYCGQPTEIRKDYDSKVLYCTNINCNTRFINRLDHFCGKKGLDIKGLSKATLEKLINWEWVNSIIDIFKLHSHQSEWMKKPGFGQASVNKIINAIEDAKNCTFDKYLCALGIPLIGKVASKALMNTFHNYETFKKAIDEKDEKLYQIAGIGEVMIETLLNYDYTEADEIFNKYINEITMVPVINNNLLDGKVFVITGKLKSFKNRDELKTFIESKGGKVTGSVTSKTSYLINNDTGSTTAKNLTAIKLKVPIINEDEFLTLVTPPNENIEPSYLASIT